MTSEIAANKNYLLEHLRSPRSKAMVVALSVLVVLIGIWAGGHVWYRNALLGEMRGQVFFNLDPYGNALVLDLRRRIDLIYGLNAWVAIHHSSGNLRANFEPFARQLGQGVAGVRYMSIAPGGVQRFVFPMTGNESNIGHDLLDDFRAEVREGVARALRSRKIVLSGPYESLSGGLEVVARLAVHLDDRFWGLINLAVDIPPILEETGVAMQQGLQLALRDNRGHVFFGERLVFDSAPVIHRVELPDGYWDLAAIPIMGWSEAIRRDLRIFDAAVLVSFFLISAITYLVTFRNARLGLRVQEGTRELTEQLKFRGIIEKQLRIAEARYRDLVEMNPDTVLVSFNKKIVYVNDAAARLLGVAKSADLLGRSPFDLVHADQRAEVEQRYAWLLEARESIPPMVQTWVRLDGKQVYVETVAAPLAWEGETAVQIIMRDITELRKSEMWSRSLLETTQDAVVRMDRHARITMFNSSAERIFGYSRAEVEGKKVNLLMAEPYASEHDEYLARYHETGEARAIGRIRTVSARRKDGTTFPIELSVTEIRLGDDADYAAFIRDISEKVNLQQQAVENERLATIGTMATKFGHELGNPLNGMSLTIQLLEQRLKRQSLGPDEQVASTLMRLKSEIARLSSLLQEFRALSRKEQYNFQPVNLRDLVSEAIEIELPRYTEQGIQVESSFSTGLPLITVDIDKMKQVILNLAKNAADAMPSGGKLSFKGSLNAGGVTLQISDTGAGIPGDTDIFEPFFTTKSAGTGIGLTIVQQIVQAHGGTITYRSELGKGTVFSIHLPVS